MKFFPGDQQQPITDGDSLHRTAVDVHMFASPTASQLFVMKPTCSMPLPVNNLPSCPKAADLTRCSSHTDPNIMQPSPENQTHEYLIGLSRPIPSRGTRGTAGLQRPVILWESKPMWGQSLPPLTCERPSGWCWQRLFAWRGAPHRCQGITDE